MSAAEGLADVLWLRSLPQAPDWVVLTMAVDPFELRLVQQLLPAAQRLLIVETTEALQHLAEFVPLAHALWRGGKDLSAALGCSRTQGLDRARTLLASAAAGRLPLFDDVHRPFADLEGLRRACRPSRERGLGARVTLDAAQVALIHDEASKALNDRTMHRPCAVI